MHQRVASESLYFFEGLIHLLPESLEAAREEGLEIYDVSVTVARVEPPVEFLDDTVHEGQESLLETLLISSQTDHLGVHRHVEERIALGGQVTLHFQSECRPDLDSLAEQRLPDQSQRTAVPDSLGLVRPADDQGLLVLSLD